MKFLSKIERGLVWFFDIGRIVILVAIISVVFYYTLGQFFVVSGVSMKPNLKDGQWLLISKINHYKRSPQRGEVVVFYFPGTKNDKYIKRIVGLPGERVVVKKGQVFINGNKLFEGYLDKNEKTQGQVNIKLNEGEYFVLGDNRDHSNDSRAWGALPQEEIIGQAVFAVYPFSEKKSIVVPGYHFR